MSGMRLCNGRRKYPPFASLSGLRYKLVVTAYNREGNYMEQQSPPSTQPPTPPAEAEKMVVFAPRIDPALREQIEGIRGITGQTINQVGQEALQGWVEAKLADEGIREQAMADIDAEQQRLQERRASIERVLGGTAGGGSEEGQASGGAGRSGRRSTRPSD